MDPAGLFPDVRVVERRLIERATVAVSASVALAEPVIVPARSERMTERFLQIIDTASGNRVVTVVEFLSPTNKLPGEGRVEYLRKHEEICHSDTNLVEIDLNRTGRHTLAVDLQNIRTQHRTSYMACVRRVTTPGDAEIYPMPLWQPLPVLKVPLRPTDADVPLDLQLLIEQCFENGAYEDEFDYSRDPEPPLRGADAEWADELLRGKGLRSPRPKRKRKPKR
ncbi:MAG: DUF4058 family protein [Gemmataceae bacterium]